MAARTIQEIADAVNGTLLGDAEAIVDHAAGLEEASPGALSFLANSKYESQLATTGATAVIVSRKVDTASCILIQVDNPDLAFAKALDLLVPPPPRPAPGIDAAAIVSPEARIGDKVSVGAGSIIEAGAVIGDNSVIYPQTYIGFGTRVGQECIIYPQVVVYHDVVLGARVTLHSHAVIGSDGFGYAWDGKQHVKIPQIGTVEIGDDVEIGSGTVVDRARFGKTVIGSGTKLDNLIQIAHNVKIGSCCAFAAQVGISGSTTIGNGVLMGGQTGVAGHVGIGDGAIFSARTGITKNMPAGVHYTGYPARPHDLQLNEWRNIKALPRLRAMIKDIEKRIEKLESDS